MRRRHLGTWALGLGLFETACFIPGKNVGELPTDGTTTGPADTEGEPTLGDPTAGSAGSGGSDDSGGAVGSACGPEGPPCIEDQDGDCVGLGEDNAPDVHNPDQADVDGDGIADPVDRCPVVASPVEGLEPDADHDGLGNECDPCRRVAAAYDDAGIALPGYLRIRNVTSTADADGDGIGDACDNCIHVPNCEGYGPGSPWQPGDPIADGDSTLCQADADHDLVGDACEGLAPLPGAAGVVGLGPDDDLDQDGLSNVVDACPRAPVGDAIACVDDGDCPATRACEIALGLCDHADADGDGVGDVCDNCPFAANPLQIGDASQQELDDPDGDFRGNACEWSGTCNATVDPVRIDFYPVSASGWCCTTSYPGDDERLDPDGLPLRIDCSAEQEAAFQCRAIPASVALAPGVVFLPAGCEQALADAGLTPEENLPLQPDDVGGVDALWPHACWLPPLDQDFDGLGDACDTCPFAFDPEGLPFVDANDMLWPDRGKYCNGDYTHETVCGSP